MKYTCFILVITVVFGCGNPAAKNDSPDIKQDTASITTGEIPAVFTLADAERILGEPAHLEDSTASGKGGTSTYSLTYSANSKESNNGKRGNLYVMLEQYKDAAAAGSVYTSIKKSNENHGIKTLTGIGDEAYFHTDNENFYFVLVRKGSRLFRMKVNKVTRYTSQDEFNRVTAEVAGKM